MLSTKAEILGLLCAEGTHYIYITKYLEFDKRRNKSYKRQKTVEAIEFANNNPKLLEHFRNLLRETYSYSPKPTGKILRRKIVIKKKVVVQDLLQYTEFGHLKWKIPNEIVNGCSEVKAKFVRGFYEGDGIKPDLVNNGLWRLRIASKNRNGLLQIQELLSHLNIRSGVYFSSRRGEMYELAAFGKNCVNFIRVIKPIFKCRGKMPGYPF